MHKILQIVNYMAPHIGGIEQVARDILNALKGDDIEQKVICFNEDAEDPDHVCRREETVSDYLDGVEVIRCGCICKTASQSLSLTFHRQLKNIMDSFQPDVVIFHYPNPFEAAFLLPYLKGEFRFIVYWHLDIVKQKILGKIFHRQSLALLERAELILTGSPNYISGSTYLSRFREKCVVVPYSIDPRRIKITPGIISKAQKIREEYAGKWICFAVGRHVPYKGMNYLVKASRLLDDRFAVLIGGEGPMTNVLVNEAKDDAKIHFLGRLSDEDLAAFFVACDIIAFPSVTKNEAFGISLAEGMSFGKPAVTFQIPGSGVNYVSLHGITGIECPNRDSSAFAEALKQLATDEKRRKQYGQAAKKRVSELFTYEQFRRNIRDIILKSE